MIAFVDHGCSERLLEARKADEELRAVAAGHGALALAIGDTLRELFATERLAELHCIREKDYMREKLGIPPRTGYGFLKLSRETKGKEVLRRAILCGAITPNKALAIARVCSPELESAWVGYAMKTSLAELTRRVKEVGGEPLGARIGGALPLQATPPGASGPLDRGDLAPPPAGRSPVPGTPVRGHPALRDRRAVRGPHPSLRPCSHHGSPRARLQRRSWPGCGWHRKCSG